jgi:hypothetical protein
MQPRARMIILWISLMVASLTGACDPMGDFQAPCLDSTDDCKDDEN